MRVRVGFLAGAIAGAFGLGLMIGLATRQSVPTLPGRVLSSSTTVTTTVELVASPTPPAPTSIVVRVVDGDTIELADGQRVRYLGIDTPESVDPRKGVACFGREAAERNRDLVEGQAVRLQRDVSDRDRYGRLLRYVYLGDELVNEQLVRDGYARTHAYPPDVRYQSRFEAAERDARAAGRGLWSACTTLRPVPEPAATDAFEPLMIKGNISANGERIYHSVECASYAKTRIDLTAGERWFVTPQEAQAAGWRRAANCN